ncbi:MAG: CHASE3 domain-containing protein, partial [bacterium]
PRWALSRQATWILAGAAALLLLIGIGGRLQLSTALDASDAVAHTQNVLESSKALLNHVLDAETGQRGYLLSDEPDYLSPYTAGRDGVQNDLAQLRRLLADNEGQQARLQAIAVLATAKLDELQRTIDSRQSEGKEAALAIIKSDVGRKTMDRIRTLVGELEQTERELLHERLAERAMQRKRLANVLLLGAIGALGMMLLGVMALNTSSQQRLAAQYRLRESEERLRTTLRSIGDAVIATDTQGSIVFMNPIAQQLTAWSDREAAGQPLDVVFNIINEETRAVVESPVAKVLREGTIVGLANHTVLIARDGSERPIDDSGAPIRDAGSAIMGVVLVFRDVSERQQMEVEQDARRRAEMATAAALAAQHAAESANIAKDQFLAVLSHELRSPLNAVVGWLAMLRRGALDAAQYTRALDTIERNVQVQAQLINDLLDVSRIISGKLSLEEELLDMDEVMQTALDNARPAAVAKGIRLATTVEPLGGIVRGDVKRLLQVVGNLLTNALKFTPSGGEVTVRVCRRDGQACIDVIDSGVGISAEFLPHVFDRFRQADESDARAHGGLGLGLSIVKHLVERHGGTVEALSDGLGNGSTFRVCLPLHAAAPDVTPTAPTRQPAQAPVPIDLEGLHILVVDDDADTREGLCLALEVNGARVTPAESVTAALAELALNLPDVIVSDIGMPGGTGLDLMRSVRSRFGAVPAIAISGYASREDRAAALAAGFIEHLAKPIDPSVLLSELRRFVPR